MRLKSFGRVLIVLVIVAGAVLAFYQWRSTHPTGMSQAVPAMPVVSPTPSPSASPSPQYPVPIDSGEALGASASGIPGLSKPVPSLNHSDPSLAEALSALLGRARFENLFKPTNIARRIVVTIDDATGHRQPSNEYSPLKAPASQFLVTRRHGITSISARNFKRYAAYAELARFVSARKLAAVYVHYYPLLQSAYQELGKPGYFNDRVIKVIADLLRTPEIRGPIQVIRPSPHSRYKFADKQLESLSWGQKILVRMGPANAAVIKQKLRQIRNLLIRLHRTR